MDPILERLDQVNGASTRLASAGTTLATARNALQAAETDTAAATAVYTQARNDLLAEIDRIYPPVVPQVKAAQKS